MIGRLSIELLEAFVAIIEEGNFTKAGERLGRTQACISSQIKKLEERVGHSLLTRSHSGPSMTASGITLLQYARSIIEVHDCARLKLSMPELTGVIRIGMPEWFSQHLFQNLLCEFAYNHPSVKMEMEISSSCNLRRMIQNSDLDLAIVISNEEDNKEDTVAVELLHWVTSQSHSLLSKDVLPFALFDKQCVYRDMCINLLNAHGCSWREAFSSNSTIAIRSAALSGLGIAMLPSSLIDSGLSIIKVNNLLPNLPSANLSIITKSQALSTTITSLKAYLFDSTSRFYTDTNVVKIKAD